MWRCTSCGNSACEEALCLIRDQRRKRGIECISWHQSTARPIFSATEATISFYQLKSLSKRGCEFLALRKDLGTTKIPYIRYPNNGAQRETGLVEERSESTERYRAPMMRGCTKKNKGPRSGDLVNGNLQFTGWRGGELPKYAIGPIERSLLDQRMQPSQ